MKVSILIAHYNNNQYLEETLQSCYLQSYDDWEVILVDDGSKIRPDLSLVPEKFRNNVKLHFHEKNKGVGAAFRSCAELSTGELLCMLGAEDTLSSDAIERCVEIHIKYKNVCMTNSQMYECDNFLNVLGLWPYRKIMEKGNHSNIRDIHRKYGTLKLKSYPMISPFKRRFFARTKPFQSWSLLNYVPYLKAEVKEQITKHLNWRDYGGKHYESVFTRFYQGYILPNKFKVDKRKAHLSNLIFSGQLSKEEAIKQLEEPIYPIELFENDLTFVLKKLNLTLAQFELYLQTPARSHSEFNLSSSLFDEYPLLKPYKKLYKKISILK